MGPDKIAVNSQFSQSMMRHEDTNITRRSLLGVSVLGLVGCVMPQETSKQNLTQRNHYAARVDGGHRVSAVNTDWVDPKFLRKEVANDYGLKSGDMMVLTSSNHLIYAVSESRALRYGVTLGQEGSDWRGEGYIARKSHWPTWTPTPRMVSENLGLSKYAGGMPGGSFNPLGARALYIYRGGADTLYRVHGTHVTWRIGEDYSSGCVRMFNQDVIEVFDLVSVGARITVT